MEKVWKLFNKPFKKAKKDNKSQNKDHQESERQLPPATPDFEERESPDWKAYGLHLSETKMNSSIGSSKDWYTMRLKICYSEQMLLLN